MELKERLFRYRVKKNLSQQQLAEKLGCTRESINAFENGKRVPGKLLQERINILLKGIDKREV